MNKEEEKAVPGMTVFNKPKLKELWFRQKFMSDEDTMSYNHVWGGTIPFPESDWEDWYEHWLVNHGNNRFYRYLADTKNGTFVGEAAYHFDEKRKFFLADVIVAAEYRGKGYGREGLRLLCDAAKANGVDVLRDDIAIDNPAIRVFLKAGFTEEFRTDEIIMLKKDLKPSPGK
ncbi:MAG: GNAT family N-acetyltransferase [Eubacterium sp.]|nr:GNAT family N-acetyltransferase [Eubacterium sp.]